MPDVAGIVKNGCRADIVFPGDLQLLAE